MQLANLKKILMYKKMILIILLFLIAGIYVAWIMYQKHETKVCIQQMIEANQGKDIIGNISSIYKYCEIIN